MSVRQVCEWCLVAALAAVGVPPGLNSAIGVEPGQPGAEDGIEVLTRGPVHEAFAETVTFDPEPGIVVPKAPPAAIEELPPDQKPEGANVEWIPGYWGWDDERDDFLWVSGVWRALPPGRQWVPGYWGQSAQGIQWTSGYWADAAASEVAYLPEPPATVEAGPNIAAPSADQIWLPGCWVWNNGRYAWRPGFWAPVQPDWVWIPARYVSAPRGYIYVDGYWDYSVARRGVLFAPVYFAASVYSRPGFSYSPAMVINPDVFTRHLFLRPGYQHYYFGDYYAASYSNAGFYPWFSFHSNRRGYDPIYSHQRWQHRQDSQWERRIAEDFENRRDHEDARPPRTWSAQRARTSSAGRSGERKLLVAAPLEELSKSKDSPLRFQSVDKTERQRLSQYGQEVRRFREER
ncbi:MAG: YXWGXW repeat-containing protein, partial [Bryobacteraceae bacterium]|nr:YXWGXW repeat-containing protein [Bryobacteraceae bacterium]